jgi:2'-5' RNA ligase
MEDFFATLGRWWPPGREDLHWHLLPEPALTTELTRHYEDLTHRPGLAPVAPHWCHITVQDIAPAADVTPDELGRIVAHVRLACAALPPAGLTLGPPVAGRYGLGCPVTPAGEARRLWELTVAASQAETAGRFPTRPAAYHPHLSLAYGVASRGDESLHEWLATHPARTVTFTATQLSLVAQSPDGAGVISWRPLATVPLRRPGTPAP